MGRSRLFVGGLLRPSDIIAGRFRGVIDSMNAHSALLVLLYALASFTQAAEPTRWTPEALSSAEYESSPSFTPDGREMFFMRADRAFQNYRLLWSRCAPTGWGSPVPPPFAAPAPVLEGDPFVSPDGRRVYFISSRHGYAQGRGTEDLDIWYADRLADGRWSSRPTRLPEPVNSTGSELLPRVTADGTLYFGSDRAGGFGGADIYVANQGANGTWSVVNAGPSINTAHNEYEADVSRDQKTLILVADRGDRSHLYLFRRKGAGWIEERRLNALPTVFQVGPLMSPTADRVLFAQADAARSGEIFLLDLSDDPDRGWPPACPSRETGG